MRVAAPELGIGGAADDGEAGAQEIDLGDRRGRDRGQPPVLVGGGDQLPGARGGIDALRQQVVAPPQVDRIGLDRGIVAPPGDADVEAERCLAQKRIRTPARP